MSSHYDANVKVVNGEACYEVDGSIYRIKPWEQNLRCSKLVNGQWVPDRGNPRLLIATYATKYRHREKLNAVAEKVLHIDDDILSEVETYEYGQYGMLFLARNLRSYRDRSLCNDPWCWAIAIAWQEGRLNGVQIHNIMNQAPWCAARRVFGQPIAYDPRRLGHIQLDRADEATWHDLLHFIVHHAETREGKFGRIRDMHIESFRGVYNINNKLYMQNFFLRELAAGASASRIDEIVENWEDSLLHAGEFEMDDVIQQLHQLQSDRELWSIRTKLEQRYALRRVLFDRLGDDAIRSFPDPPLKGDDFLQPILNTEELLEEEVTMGTEILWEVEKLISGEEYAYKFLWPRRGSVLLKQTAGSWELKSVMLRGWEEPPATVRELVLQWIHNRQSSDEE